MAAVAAWPLEGARRASAVVGWGATLRAPGVTATRARPDPGVEGAWAGPAGVDEGETARSGDQLSDFAW